MKSNYKKLISLSNEAARLNGFNDYGRMWQAPYEDPNLVENLKKIWKQVEPLYDEIHTYTKFKLSEIYGADKVNVSDPLIPAQLLGIFLSNANLHFSLY